MRILDISNVGIVEIEFNQLLFVRKNLTRIDEKVLEINLVQDMIFKENQETLINWFVTNMTESSLLIQLKFLNPSFISAYSVTFLTFRFLTN